MKFAQSLKIQGFQKMNDVKKDFLIFFSKNLPARKVLAGCGGLDDESSMSSQKSHGGGNVDEARFPSGAPGAPSGEFQQHWRPLLRHLCQISNCCKPVHIRPCCSLSTPKATSTTRLGSMRGPLTTLSTDRTPVDMVEACGGETPVTLWLQVDTGSEVNVVSVPTGFCWSWPGGR